MGEIHLRPTEYAGLREIAERGVRGLLINQHEGSFSNGRLGVSVFRVLAGLKLVDVVSGRILISSAGLQYLDNNP